MVIHVGDANIKWQPRFAIWPCQIGLAVLFQVVIREERDEGLHTEAVVVEWSLVCPGIGEIGPVAFVKLAIVIAKPFTAPRCSASQLLLINKNELVNILISRTTCMLRNMAAHVKSIAVSAVENCEVNGIKIIVGTLKRALITQKFIGGIYLANLGKIDD